MRVLFTGAAGYIGLCLRKALQEKGYYVIPLYNWPSEPQKRCYDGPFEQAWFADLAKGFGDLIKEKPPDTVIHLAGRVDLNLQPNPRGAHLPPVPGPCDISALYRDNVLATANVLEYCLKAGVKHLIFASTQAVYGMGHNGFLAFAGHDGAYPLEHYAASKAAAEGILEVGRKQGLMVSILRLPGVFGGDRKSGAVYNMCQDALQKGEIEVTHPHPIVMNAMHIDDVVAGLAAVTAWRPRDKSWAKGLTITLSWDDGGCSLDILADEIASLVPNCKVRRSGPKHPVFSYWDTSAHTQLDWHPKPRKERLRQVLEQIRSETQIRDGRSGVRAE